MDYIRLLYQTKRKCAFVSPTDQECLYLSAMALIHEFIRYNIKPSVFFQRAQLS